ncbi:enoyl-CoA hydratase/isomerase family protein [Maritimibacter sp. DP07]|uniref:Enoyl-CoA hydratase/isomerase family protein n=1 Tax=Maritimibacter harenae TaxID=2606218 RepID=A0A845LY38_9RHOB|nr:enoyl-CoA hydratase/isomerase family protein [Maritimibacter harenae]MZR11682.1 enoyl-CoA hydratase/isomerase family protein [Maritimibacter harenae]
MIETTIDEGVMTLELNRPPMNAIDSDMARALAEKLGDAALADCRVIIVTGANGGFSAGSDVAELAELRGASNGPGALLSAQSVAFERLAAQAIPTIAAVEGLAMGGGAELVLCCDFIVASESARFSFPEVRLGVFPALGGTVRLPRRIGYDRALDLILTGREIDAETAMNWGLLSRRTAQGEALDAARALARKLAMGPKATLATIKNEMRAALHIPETEATAQALKSAIAIGDSPEAAEGLRAFFAKKRPDFSNLP